MPKQIFWLIFLCAFNNSFCQNCPPNIDFEFGDFSGWQSYTGNVAAVGGQNVISLSASSAVNGRHDMLSSFPGNGLDPYGGFPVNCPNGSGHSIKLGNNTGGAEAEGISYEFVIPASANEYTLIYNYAVVFQDPNHREFEQPRMQIEITNVTDGNIITCSSFSFFPFGTPLPGFIQSPITESNTPIWYKDWTAVTINLNGNAGKRIKLFFKTSDCTFRRHFGYAYIDVGTECSGKFEGASFCPDDTLVNVVAPYGYQNYTWYNNTFSTILGNTQTLNIAPPPPTSIDVAVVLNPYNGYGCLDTLYTTLTNNLLVIADAGEDKISCNHSPEQIGSAPLLGVRYSWTPTLGLSNANIANPIATPDTTTTYVVTARSIGGGCIHIDSVVVKAALVNNNIKIIGKDSYCIGSGDSTILKVAIADSIQWYKDDIAIIGAQDTLLRVTQSGTYYAILFGGLGCKLVTAKKVISITSVPVSNFSVNVLQQCLVGNQFIFTNTSTNAVGNMQYKWILGDGTVANTKDVFHIYAKAGSYQVKLIVSSSNVCADSTIIPITVFQNAIADFTVLPTCVNLPVKIINNTVDTLGSTIHYLWTFSNGQTSIQHTPNFPTYANFGLYPLSLTVSTTQCPLPGNLLKKNIIIDEPKAAVRYNDEIGVVNLPLTLHARQFGDSVLWKPFISLDNFSSYSPIFVGAIEQDYTIQIKTKSGCITVDTQMVKLVKEIAIYVPSAFTPNGDGLNDILRPVFYGIKQLLYFKIYDRWGKLLYQTQTLKQGWNGMYKNTILGAQTVVWILEALGADGKIYAKHGTTVLIK
ncbi:MAG: PKD domain-containing protein [Ferruginibacter sp.]